MRFRDRNSKYFHGITIVKTQKNYIHLLQNENGDWMSDILQILNMVSSFYKNHFQDEGIRQQFCLWGSFLLWMSRF